MKNNLIDVVRYPGGVVKTNLLVRAVLALFFLSGACGLIYQSLWPQYLKLLLGHSSYAQSIVLVVFIGGMAVGSWLAGRFASGVGSPLLGYAICEALIGVMAIGFHQLYVPVSEWAYQSFLPSVCAAQGWCGAQWLLAALLITPQSILLGATFPFLAAGLLRYLGGRTGWLLGTAYGVNTLGAVLGVLMSSFVLLPKVGLPGTMFLAGGANIVVALIVYAIERELKSLVAAGDIAGAVDTADTQTNSGSASTRILLCVAAFTGLSSFIYEIVWIRMLSLVLGSATHTFEIVLAGYLFGLGCGGYWVKTRVDRIKSTVVFLAKVQLAMGLFAALTIVFYHSGFDFMAWIMAGLQRSQEGYVLYLFASALLTLLFVFPTTFCAGMTLPLITHILYKTKLGEGSIGMTYAANTLGSIVGILLAVHVGLPYFGLNFSLGFAAIIDVVLGVILLMKFRGVPFRGVLRSVPVSAYVVLAVVFAITFFVSFDPLYMSAGVFRVGVAKFDQNSAKVLFSQDGKTATVSVLELQNGVVSIRTNGKPDASISMRHDQEPSDDEFTMSLAGFVGPMYVPGAKDVAVVGFGSGMTTSVLLSFPSIKQVDTIEIEPKMVEGARHFLPVVDAAYSDPRSKIVIDDAKSYFSRSGKKYDIIVTEPSNPWVSGVASLFTEEFYSRSARSLNDKGVFVQWIQLYEFDSHLLSSIVSAMRKVFPYYEVFTDGTNIVLVSSRNELPSPNYGVLYDKKVDAWFKRLGTSQSTYWKNRVAGWKVMNYFLHEFRSPVNSDYYPYVDTYAPKARFEKASVGWLDAARYMPIPIIRWIEKSEYGNATGGFSGVNSDSSTLTFSELMADPGKRDLGREVQRSLTLMKNASVACQYDELAESVVKSMIHVGAALHTIGAGPALGFWSSYSLPDCKALRDRKAFEWRDLLDAVARDDLESVARRAEVLRTAPVNYGSVETEFLAAAHVGALAVLGKSTDAVSSMKSYRARLSSAVLTKPWVMLIKAKIEVDLMARPKALAGEGQ